MNNECTGSRETESKIVAGKCEWVKELAERANDRVLSKLNSYARPTPASISESAKCVQPVQSVYFSGLDENLSAVERLLNGIIEAVDNCEL